MVFLQTFGRTLEGWPMAISHALTSPRLAFARAAPVRSGRRRGISGSSQGRNRVQVVDA